MRIELDLTKDEALLLLNSMRKLLASTKNPKTFNSIALIIAEIESDAHANNEIYKILKSYLIHFKKKGTLISKSANLRLGLRLNPMFINKSSGLKAVCNKVLHRMLITYKPTTNSKGVPLKGVQKCEVVQDVINLIKVTYEAAV